SEEKERRIRAGIADERGDVADGIAEVAALVVETWILTRVREREHVAEHRPRERDRLVVLRALLVRYVQRPPSRLAVALGTKARREHPRDLLRVLVDLLGHAARSDLA